MVGGPFDGMVREIPDHWSVVPLDFEPSWEWLWTQNPTMDPDMPLPATRIEIPVRHNVWHPGRAKLYWQEARPRQ
jgi:hypothetical protein